MDIERKNLLRDWFVEELQKRGAKKYDWNFYIRIPINKELCKEVEVVFSLAGPEEIKIGMKIFDRVFEKELGVYDLMSIGDKNLGFRGFILSIIESMLLDISRHILIECDEKIK